MGCDIHAYWEGLDNGQWYFLKEWDFGRNYQVFSKMSDGHGRGHEEPISKAKGLPSNVSFPVKRMIECHESHICSFLNAKELMMLFDWLMENGDLERAREIENTEMWLIDHYDFEDFRLVFGFDN